MVNDIQLTVVGNLTADPEMRFTQNGIGVANFTVASTPRTFDRNKNEFVDGEAIFLRCSVWRDYAENVATSLTKGTRVVVSGKLKVRSYEKDGVTRYSNELEVDEIGPSLRYATALVQKVQRDASQTRQQPPSEDPYAGANPDPTFQEPWATAQPGGQAQAADAWSTPGSFGDGTPF